MTGAVGQLAQHHVARRVLGVEQGDAFVAGQRFHFAVFLLKEPCGDAVLLDGFHRPILFLENHRIAHQAVGRLRERTEKTRENRGSLEAVTCFDQAVELDAVILRGESGLVQARVDVSECLQGFLMRGRLVENRLVFGHGFAELVFFETAPRFFEMPVDFRSHGNSRFLRRPRACWGSAPLPWLR